MSYWLLMLFFLYQSSWAFDYSQDLEEIKNLGKDFEPTGTICEEVARLRYSEKYPSPDYSAITGIQYSDKDGNTLGELDLVVFDNKTQVAILIAEVKCYTTPKSGFKKAKDQRKKFLENVHSSKALNFKWLFDKTKKLTKTQFNKVNQFLLVGQKGTLDDGYNYELPYSLAELMKMRSEIIDCQNQNLCLKPNN